MLRMPARSPCRVIDGISFAVAADRGQHDLVDQGTHDLRRLGLAVLPSEGFAEVGHPLAVDALIP
jgi:hypothetical protein